MARTTKRKTKHRGNAAGVVESRGRTGRKPTAAEKGTAPKKAEKPNRLDRPPTWRGAFVRAMIAGLLVLGISALMLKGGISHALLLLPVVLIVYVPLGYYTDRYMYNRRQQKKATAAR